MKGRPGLVLNAWTRGLAACVALLVMVGAALAADRVALVVGNGAYAAAPPLPNPTRDARAVATALERLGFEVLDARDLDAAGMRRAIREFGVAAEGAEVALFFYAGHGIQMAGRNYLVPTDAELQREGHLDLYALPLDLVIAQMERGAKTNIILLDACRDNPFETRLSRSMGATRSSALLGRGLAPVKTAGGIFVGFATDPGEVAFDGAGDHSPFTEAVLKHMRTGGLEINAMMTRVRADVFSATQGRQRPWSTSSLLREVYLAPSEEGPVDRAARDLAAWQAIPADAGPEAYRAYLDAFPDGLFAEIARARLGQGMQAALAPLVPEQTQRASPPPRPERPELAALAPAEATEPAAGAPPATSQIAEPSRSCEICPPMVAVPGGETVLGNPAAGAPAAERPAVRQTIAPFEMALHEITVGLVRRFEAETGHRIPRGCHVWTAEGRMRKDGGAYWGAPGFAVDDDMPAACLNWTDATRILDWLNGKTPGGGGYRLPSEAEFEYALKAGREGAYPWAGAPQDACRFVNAADSASRFRWRNASCADGAPGLAAPASYPANGFGLHDLTGNLWEWTADCWNATHRGAAPDGRARQAGQCESRVLRGGSWDDPLENLRVTYRVGIPAARRQANVGFRMVRDTGPAAVD